MADQQMTALQTWWESLPEPGKPDTLMAIEDSVSEAIRRRDDSLTTIDLIMGLVDDYGLECAEELGDEAMGHKADLAEQVEDLESQVDCLKSRVEHAISVLRG